jgi:hypothetical protein
MSGSLMKTSTTVHNDYVDMNGSPVNPARNQNQIRNADTTGPKAHEEASVTYAVIDKSGNITRAEDGLTTAATTAGGQNNPADDAVAVDADAEAAAELEDDKPVDHGPDYSNLMSVSQRSENLYEQLR